MVTTLSESGGKGTCNGHHEAWLLVSLYRTCIAIGFYHICQRERKCEMECLFRLSARVLRISNSSFSIPISIILFALISAFDATYTAVLRTVVENVSQGPFKCTQAFCQSHQVPMHFWNASFAAELALPCWEASEYESSYNVSYESTVKYCTAGYGRCTYFYAG